MANDYAIIEMGGKQYRVEKGDSVVVDRVNAEQGAKVSPRAVAFAAGDKTVLDGPELEKVKVDAVVAEHLKGEKIRVFKYRPKKRYRKTTGHRSLLTRLEISDIKLASRKPASSAAATEDKDGEAAAKKKEAGTQAKKPAARKPATRKAPARKAPASKKSDSEGS
jgi:large subunit ribosomal protein L21